MDFHKEAFDGLRSKGYTVGPVYLQAAPDGFSAHQFVTVNDTAMPVEWASALNAGHVTLPEIVRQLQG